MSFAIVIPTTMTATTDRQQLARNRFCLTGLTSATLATTSSRPGPAAAAAMAAATLAPTLSPAPMARAAAKRAAATEDVSEAALSF